MIDTVLAGRYRIQSQLGEGGMAVVYKAMDVVLHRIVAIKVLRPQYAGDDEFVERFRREAQAAASLSHPNVVNIFDVGEADDVHYIVLEYVQGQNLKEIVRKEGRLEPRRAARIGAAVARALQAAHERQIVHRDIKPHNILITPEGRVKVTDFGIARASSSATLTEAGMVIGSVHYFSPEQARGQPVGPAADLYSLGVVLYEMLTGEVPFRGESPVSVALKHLQETPVSPKEHVGTIPDWLELVVLKALQKDPAQRHRSAAQMAVDLAWRTADATAAPLPVGEGVAGHEGERKQTGLASRTDATDAHTAVRGLHPLRGRPQGVEPRGFDPSARPPPVLTGDEADTWVAARDAAAAEDEEAAVRKPRWRGWLVTVSMLLVIGLGVSAGTPLLLDVIFPPEVDVPGMAGMTYDEARPLAQAAGLSLVVEAEVYDRHVPEGFIVRHVPEAGRTVRKGREVQLFLSRGPEIGRLPDVVGRPIRDARVLLTQAGFTLAAEQSVHDADAPANEVVNQEPAPGTEWEKGSAVTLWVSKPGAVVQTRVDVPDLRGVELADAEEELVAKGLILGNTWAERNPLVPADTVIDQNPPPGTTVDGGTAVDVVFSEGVVRLGETGAETSGAETEQSPPIAEGPTDADGQRPQDDARRDVGSVFEFGSEFDFGYNFDFGVQPQFPTGSDEDLDGDSAPAAGSSPEQPIESEQPVQSQQPSTSGEDEEQSRRETSAGTPEQGSAFAPIQELTESADGHAGEVIGRDPEFEESTRAESGDRQRRRAKVDVYIPPGAAREVVVLVIDDFGLREAFRQIVPGDTELEQLIDGRGREARLQVYVDGVMQTDEPFPDM